MPPRQPEPTAIGLTQRLTHLGGRSPRLWVALAVSMAFADSSIVVLALPQIVDRLHTSISHVTWVIAAYNLALIAAAVAIMPLAGRVSSKRALTAGLAIFGLSSIGAGVAHSLSVLIVLRCVQGAGGGLLACASLPMLTSATAPGRSPRAGWAAAAALGAAIGPALGGVLTQLFDWRAIFLAQAPVAAIAGLAISTIRLPQSPPVAPSRIGGADQGAIAPDSATPHPAVANLALALISAALIGALFLVTTVLINVWQLTPLSAGAVMTTIPVATVIAERAVKGRSAIGLAATGAVALAVGLTGLALISHRQLGWALIALCLCGAGLGMAFPTLTAAALRSPGTPIVRAARTVAARDAGLILGLLILTPVLVSQLNAAPRRATAPIAKAVLTAPIPVGLKLQVGSGLLAANVQASQSQLPDINPAFARAAAQATGATRTQLAALKLRVHSLIETAATHSFRRPLLICALFALLILPALGLDLARVARRRRSVPGSAVERT